MVVACSVARNVARAPAAMVAGLGDDGASLSLDFLSGVLDPRITFTRSSSGAYFDSSGVLQTASSNAARFDYNPSTLAPRGFLIEESRTNLILESQTLDVASSGWGKSNVSISANATTAPDGTSTADKIEEDTATATHYINNTTGSYTSGTTYTASVWLKAAERGFAFLVLGAVGAFPTTAISINLTTGAVSTATGTPLNAFTQTLPNGWFRVGFSLAATSTASGSIDIRTSTDGVWANRSYTGTAGSGIYAWGAQVEAGSFPTSYIATTSATVTRAADVATIGTLTPWFNATEGTLWAQMIFPTSSTTVSKYFFSLDDGTANERLSCFKLSAGTVAYRIVDGGSATNPSNSSNSITAYAVSKVALAYKVGSNEGAGCLNGGTVTTSTPLGIPTVTTLRLGMSNGNIEQPSGWLQSIRYYPTRLPNSVLQSLTA